MVLLFAAAYLFEMVATPPRIPFSNNSSMSESLNNSNLTFVVFRAASQARPGEVNTKQDQARNSAYTRL